jgi:hypothetical protein
MQTEVLKSRETIENRLGQVAQVIVIQTEVLKSLMRLLKIVSGTELNLFKSRLRTVQAFMLLKIPSLSVLIRLLLRYRVPCWSGQEPVRSRTPLASVKNLQGP